MNWVEASLVFSRNEVGLWVGEASRPHNRNVSSSAFSQASGAMMFAVDDPTNSLKWEQTHKDVVFEMLRFIRFEKIKTERTWWLEGKCSCDDWGLRMNVRGDRVSGVALDSLDYLTASPRTMMTTKGRQMMEDMIRLGHTHVWNILANVSWL